MDTTRRVAFDGSSRHTGFILPILREALSAGGSVDGLALVEALWARMCAGTREDGSAIEANDPRWDELAIIARAAQDDPRSWLVQTGLYGSVSTEPRFVERFDVWLRMIWTQGARAALQCYGHP